MRGILLLLTSALAFAACDGSVELSRREFRTRADVVCERANERINALQIENDRELADKLATITQATAERLRELEAPDQDRDAIDRILSSLEEGADKLNAAGEQGSLRSAARSLGEAVEALAEAQRLAGRYGMRACAQFGLPTTDRSQ